MKLVFFKLPYIIFIVFITGCTKQKIQKNYLKIRQLDGKDYPAWETPYQLDSTTTFMFFDFAVNCDNTLNKEDSSLLNCFAEGIAAQYSAKNLLLIVNFYKDSKILDMGLEKIEVNMEKIQLFDVWFDYRMAKSEVIDVSTKQKSEFVFPNNISFPENRKKAFSSHRVSQ